MDCTTLEIKGME